ncbi:hypothetical protein LJR235_002382 [Pararhizobium sp. LjRoot235]|uniref:hypothetical protein n=1 Tax=Pararhizobium sp. LjRoot235 TaxID=3342291 RepID=UPI003ED01A2E
MSYMFQYAGQCLGDLIESGAMLSADTDTEILPLDVVSVILKQTLDGPFSELVNSLGMGGHAGVVKLFLGTREMPEGGTVYIVGQLNPPCLSPIPANAIEAFHKVEGVSLTDGLGIHDQAALKLLLPFAGEGEAVVPVNTEFVSRWPAPSFQELAL